MARGPTAFNPARLRERITIRRAANAKTAAGGLGRTWSTLLEDVPAEVLPFGGGSETMIANTLQGVAAYRITIRWRETEIKASDQVLWKGRELNIIAPPQDPTGRRRILTIVADTSAAQNA